MAIISSVFSAGPPQRDGRQYVEEAHTDHVGTVHRCYYLSGASDNRAAIMAARVASIVARLEQIEIERVLQQLPLPLVLNYATKTQVADVLRADFLSSRRERTWQLADWILDGLDAGEWTDVQLRNAWNLTANQWNTLKAKLVTYRTRWNEMQAIQGE